MEERPVECSQCKKNVSVIYQEIVSGTEMVWHFCDTCPVLKRKLHGNPQHPLCEMLCKNCQTSLEEVQMGSLLGCAECYHQYEKTIIKNLVEADRIPQINTSLDILATPSLHLGKTPEKSHALQSSRLVTLNAALNDALESENYEQAAYLRDQIKQLIEETK